MESTASRHGLLVTRRRSGPDRLLIALLVVAIAATVIQITMGGIVRVTGSGDGCPDWPRCFGRWVPPLEYHALLEYTHRSIGVLVGVVIAAAAARVWWRRVADPVVIWCSTAALPLVAIVGGVGGAVVLSELDPAIRTLHLALAETVVLLLAAALVAATHRPLSHRPSRSAVVLRDTDAVAAWRAPLLRLTLVAAALSVAALLSGSYAVWRGAGFACGSWPLCGGAVIPQSELVWVHMLHRLLAGAAAVAVLWSAHRAYRLVGGPAALRMAALMALGLMVGQVLVGAANPMSGFEQWARASHLSLATLVWLDTIFMFMLVLRPIPRSRGDLAEAERA
jgi:heme A synthase